MKISKKDVVELHHFEQQYLAPATWNFDTLEVLQICLLKSELTRTYICPFQKFASPAAERILLLTPFIFVQFPSLLLLYAL